MIDKIGTIIITMFGVGYFKYMPGTLASLLTCLIFYYSGYIYKFNIEYKLIFLLIFFIFSIILIDRFIQTKKNKDPKEIVIDEFFGQLIPLYAIWWLSPASFWDQRWIIYYSACFILFRFFDILKPYPISMIDKKIKNGLGVMLDDIVAGIYATIIVYGIFVVLR